MLEFPRIREIVRRATNGRVANDDVQFEEYEGVDALLPGIPRSQQLAAMIDLLGFTVDDLAQLGGVNREQIDDWLVSSKGTGLPQLIDDVRAISRRMAESNVLLPEEIGPWFREPNPRLEDFTPIEMIEQGRYETVLVASRKRKLQS